MLNYLPMLLNLGSMNHSVLYEMLMIHLEYEFKLQMAFICRYHNCAVLLGNYFNEVSLAVLVRNEQKLNL